jgi:AraC-like DNA-binding protein
LGIIEWLDQGMGPNRRTAAQTKMSCAMHGKHELDRNPAPAADGSPALPFEPCCDERPAPAAACHDRRKTFGDRGWAPLREACFAELKEAVETGDIARTPPLVKAVAEFALIEHGAIKPGSRRGQQALRLGHLCLANRLIRSHLSQAALSPTMVAGLLGVSVRYLHLLFETTGKSFSQTVTAQRMHLSCRLLREMPKRPIADIADACGFGSLPTFYRVFSATIGLTPGEFRAYSEPTDPVGTTRPTREAATHLTVK